MERVGDVGAEPPGVALDEAVDVVGSDAPGRASADQRDGQPEHPVGERPERGQGRADAGRAVFGSPDRAGDGGSEPFSTRPARWGRSVAGTELAMPLGTLPTW
jgi:hypothetical protein